MHHSCFQTDLNNSFLLTLARACAAKGYCSRSVGRSVGLSVSLSVCTFSLEPWLLLIPNVDMWVCATGARHSKSLERRCPRTACLWRGPKIIYSYYNRCALTRRMLSIVGERELRLHIESHVLRCMIHIYICTYTATSTYTPYICTPFSIVHCLCSIDNNQNFAVLIFH